MNSRTPDITRTTIMVLVIGVLLAASLWTMAPFIGSLVWATTIVIATWPLLLSVQRKVGGSRALATTIMTLFMLVIFIVPFWMAIGALLDASAQGADLVRSYMKEGLGPPPSWVSGVPFVGDRLTTQWQELAAGGPEAFAAKAQPYMRSVAAWLVAVTGGLGGVFLHFLLTVILSAVLYAQGEAAAAGVIAFARRLAGDRDQLSFVRARSWAVVAVAAQSPAAAVSLG